MREGKRALWLVSSLLAVALGGCCSDSNPLGVREGGGGGSVVNSVGGGSGVDVEAGGGAVVETRGGVTTGVRGNRVADGGGLSVLIGVSRTGAESVEVTRGVPIPVCGISGQL